MYNIRHTNIIAMEVVILIIKLLDINDKYKQFINDMLNPDVIQVFSTINILLKYNLYVNSTNNKVAIDLRL